MSLDLPNRARNPACNQMGIFAIVAAGLLHSSRARHLPVVLDAFCGFQEASYNCVHGVIVCSKSGQSPVCCWLYFDVSIFGSSSSRHDRTGITSEVLEKYGYGIGSDKTKIISTCEQGVQKQKSLLESTHQWLTPSL